MTFRLELVEARPVPAPAPTPAPAPAPPTPVSREAARARVVRRHERWRAEAVAELAGMLRNARGLAAQRGRAVLTLAEESGLPPAWAAAAAAAAMLLMYPPDEGAHDMDPPHLVGLRAAAAYLEPRSGKCAQAREFIARVRAMEVGW